MWCLIRWLEWGNLPPCQKWVHFMNAQWHSSRRMHPVDGIAHCVCTECLLWCRVSPRNREITPKSLWILWVFAVVRKQLLVNAAFPYILNVCVCVGGEGVWGQGNRWEQEHRLATWELSSFWMKWAEGWSVRSCGQWLREDNCSLPACSVHRIRLSKQHHWYFCCHSHSSAANSV